MTKRSRRQNDDIKYLIPQSHYKSAAVKYGKPTYFASIIKMGDGYFPILKSRLRADQNSKEAAAQRRLVFCESTDHRLVLGVTLGPVLRGGMALGCRKDHQGNRKNFSKNTYLLN